MRLDFWNNPLVVTALRVRYRRGSFSTAVALHIMLLAGGGVALQAYNHQLGGPWPRNYFIAIMAFQFLISGLIAAAETSSWIKAEVMNRTLDFQRIAALSPQQILLGKLLGEPILAYLLAIASIPLAVCCWFWGGVTLHGLVFMYVILFTMILMVGSMGLSKRLDVPPGKPDASGGAAGGLVLGLGSSVPALAEAVMGDEWQFTPTLFGVPVSFLWIIPPAQLFVAFLSFHSMTRQLINSLNPSLSKGLAYATLALVDVVAAAVVFDLGPGALDLAMRGAGFCLVHLAASLLLIMSTTPWRETLHSWVWRFRGRVPWLWDWWLGDRSNNGLTVLTFCAQGVLALGLLVVLPAVLADGPEPLRQSWPVLVSAMTTTVVLTLAFGALHQWFVLVGGRHGIPLMTLVLIMAVGLPVLLGRIEGLDWLIPLSPGAHFVEWFGGPRATYNLLPMLGLYAGLAGLAWLSVRGRLRRLEKVVDQKLERMGVTPPAALDAVG
jgi:hypothetical protein